MGHVQPVHAVLLFAGAYQRIDYHAFFCEGTITEYDITQINRSYVFISNNLQFIV